ncbi:hypothetical protein MUU72_03535 [Streptomyces sp. RS10V-4]|uniref:hypothetical protein n=1 Tax=Streptomyces rhizoryzae TaxID=2932493 RepID=UPI0020051089|nr:hypothetical protein [Streptomyces rhizoryzae]MCK7622206.1 hypothetical protein [Streptomyces rhizoryzae]
MSAAWVAGVTRARGLLAHAPGPSGAREVATAGTPADALRRLAASPYQRVPAAASLATAQRAVTGTLLWHLRVLAGWLPHRGVECLRLLASGFEIANIEARFRQLNGAEGEPAPYELGALATAWHRAARAAGPGELRAALSTSAWRDPGGTAAELAVGLRLTAAARTAARVPGAARWSAGRAALLVARERFVLGRDLPDRARAPAARLLGAAHRAPDFDAYRRRLPPAAGWALRGIDAPEGLWRAEGRWWRDIEQDGLRMARRTRYDAIPVVGAVAALSADAWRMRAALALAAHPGVPREESDGFGVLV